MRDDVEPHENFMRGWEDYKVILSCDWSERGNTNL